MSVVVIGAGLAGCEAAWQLAKRGIPVTLYEMKRKQRTPAQNSDSFAELVCSNSLRSDQLENAVGLLKEELRRLGSLILACADETRVEAGGALAVDREGFAALVTKRISECPLITVIEDEVSELPANGDVIVATGPLTSDRLSQSIARYFGREHLYFFDAAAPIVTRESVDMSKAFFASRYDKGTPDYINCPMDEAEYTAFYEALVSAETAELKAFEGNKVFEGCMPVEVMAKRGKDTLLFGPLKPVGLLDPRTEKQFHAVVQLRKDNSGGTLYNLVGFQTHLRFHEQQRVFSMIPGLEKAEFIRYGVMHRNTYIQSPSLLSAQYEVRTRQGLYFAGQMTGVEGYVESTASGFVAGLALAERLLGKAATVFSPCTAIGALGTYISNESIVNFQPMNCNFGLFSPLTERIRKKRDRAGAMAQRSLLEIDGLLAQVL